MTELTPGFGPEPAGFGPEPDATSDPEMSKAAGKSDAVDAEPAPAIAEPNPLDEPAAAPEPDPPVPFPVPEHVADYSADELAPSLAAVCFALNRPVTLPEAAAILGRSQAVVAAAADHLAGTLRGGSLMLQRHQEELQLVTRPEVAWAVQRALNPEKPGRLSRAALETLAIVAYRQPLTRASIEAIRGVNCEAVLDSLERRGLIAEVGRQDTPGHPRLFGTTMRFLQVVGLERIESLPPLPEGLKVPELPVADWDVAPGGAMEVRGEPVPTNTSGYTTGATSTYDTTLVDREPAVDEADNFDADPDEGYGEPEPEPDDPTRDTPGEPSNPGPQAEA